LGRHTSRCVIRNSANRIGSIRILNFTSVLILCLATDESPNSNKLVAYSGLFRSGSSKRDQGERCNGFSSVHGTLLIRAAQEPRRAARLPGMPPKRA
jgi:hypothetical protein